MFVETQSEDMIQKGLLKKTFKNGEVRYYDNKKYYENFKNKHSSKECEVCGGKIGYYNHDKHLKSKKHLMALCLKEGNSDIIDILKSEIEKLEKQIENKKNSLDEK